jgi:hypothetical protein
MKIVMRKDASRIYAMDSVNYNSSFWEKLNKINGQTIEVETKYLFDNQFNTAPIEGVTESGLRIMEILVDRVIDDERVGKCRCRYCGEISTHNNVRKSSHEYMPLQKINPYLPIKELMCPKCENFNYLEDLTPTDKRLWTSNNAVWRLTLKRVTPDGRQYIVLVNNNTGLSQYPILYTGGTVAFDYDVPQYVRKGVTKAMKKHFGYN